MSKCRDSSASTTGPVAAGEAGAPEEEIVKWIADYILATTEEGKNSAWYMADEIVAEFKKRGVLRL